MYDPYKHHRRSIRLKEYDYSQEGLYFVTICVQDMRCLFGKIIDGEMALNDAGKMIEKWCMELSHKFPDITLDTYIIMPNHFHAIIINDGTVAVGADLCVCPDENVDAHVGAPLQGSPLCTVVQWFKTMTTNEYIRGVKTLNWRPFDEKLWQRNYWEHIIRSDNSYQYIADYIMNNPAQWESDKLYTK
jgi:REP element-mobilizing transposase RayT